MPLSVELQPVPFTVTAEGVVRIEGTRVPIETVVRAFHLGATAEEIAIDYPTVSLAHVYAVLAYYLAHRDAVDAYIAERTACSDSMHAMQHDPIGIRERLLARHPRTEHAA